MNKYKAKLWNRIDIKINSSIKYNNPYKDVEIIGIFKHDNIEIKLNAFWNDGNEWVLRFAPTKIGEWEYNVVCSDKSNKLSNTTGNIEVIPNESKTNIEKHGFIKHSKNNRYFTYNDGTPFFWLGDTNWQAFNLVNYYDCNYPNCNCKNQFRHILKNRKEKSFNVYQTYFDTSNGNVQENDNMWLEKYNKINPKVFSKTIDKMFEDIIENDMIIALGFGLHYVTPVQMNEEELKRFVDYIIARYSAYPIVWITGQEIDLEQEHNTYDIWKSLAKEVYLKDPYKHPITGHMFSHPRKIEDLNNQSWHSFWAIQSGHYGMAKIANKEHYKYFYDLKPTKPILETEANYEDIKCSNRFNGYEAARVSAWKAIQSGCAGYTYGGNGIWACCYNTTNKTFCLGDYSTEPWYMGLDKPASFEMKYLREFYELVGFERLYPNYNYNIETMAVSSDTDNSTIVAYFYNESLDTGIIENMKNETYYSYWYNPLTGKFIKNEEAIPKDGIYIISCKPTKNDWILLLTTDKIEITDYEEMYIHKEINKEHMQVKLSKMKKVNNYDIVCISNEDKICDFNKIKWNPYCKITTKTIVIDFKNNTSINYIKIGIGENVPKFRIYSEDENGEFTVIDDTKFVEPNIYEENNEKYIIENIIGNYEKLKLIILNSEETIEIKSIELLVNDN